MARETLTLNKKESVSLEDTLELSPLSEEEITTPSEEENEEIVEETTSESDDSFKVEIFSNNLVYNGYAKVHQLSLQHTLFSSDQTRQYSPPRKYQVVDRGYSACILPYDPNTDEVVLIKQFRPGAYYAGYDPWNWSIIAGMIPDNETGALGVDTVIREAKEEAGLDLEESNLIEVAEILNSPGLLSEVSVLFIAECDLSAYGGGIYGVEEEGENIYAKKFSLADVIGMLSAREIIDAKSLLLIQSLVLRKSYPEKKPAVDED